MKSSFLLVMLMLYPDLLGVAQCLKEQELPPFPASKTYEYEDECGNPERESQLFRSIEGTIIKVKENASLILITKGNKQKEVILSAIDTSATKHHVASVLSELLLNRNVRVLVNSSFIVADGETLVGIVLHNEKDINRELLRLGLVRYQGPIPHSISDYMACVYRLIEGEAKQRKQGIWSYER